MLLTLVFLFLVLAAVTFGHIELFAVALFVGILVGYLFRAAIASEITKFKLATIVSRLETTAKADAITMGNEVRSIASDLKSHL